MEKKSDNILYFLFILIIVVIIGVAIYLIFFGNEKTNDNLNFNIKAPTVVFVGDNDFINVNLLNNDSKSTSETLVVYKYGYLLSNKIKYFGSNFDIPFTALKSGIEEVELKSNKESKKINILVCDKINASNKTISVNNGSTYDLKFNLNSDCLSQYDFKIENPNIATYESGIVKAKKAGTTNLIISRKDESYTYKIQVKDVSLKFSVSSFNIKFGSSAKLSLSGVNGTLICKSSNTNVVTTEPYGNSCLINALAVGDANITASSSGQTATVKIKVSSDVGVEKVTLNKTSLTLNVNSSETLNATISPSTATNRNLTWTSSDSTIATVDANGKVTGKKAGTATITVKTNNNKTATCKVTVKNTGVNVRIATFNVHRFDEARPNVIASLIRNNNVDIVGMQELKDLTTGDYYAAQKVADNLNYNLAAYTMPGQINAVVSSKTFPVINTNPKNEIFLPTNCSEPYGESDRRLAKAVVKINGINISVYSGHFGLGECNEIHFKSAAEQISNDPNPSVVLADYNHIYITNFNKYFVSKGFEIAAHETGTNNMWNAASYCDSVLILSRGHINVIKSETVDTYNTYSDHNMVIATLEIH